MKFLFVIVFFTLVASTWAECSFECKNGGSCQNDACVCIAPYTGVDCTFYDMALTSGQTADNQAVGSGSWNFYHIQLQSAASIYFFLSQDSSNQDCDLYIKKDNYPSRISYYARENGIRQSFYLNVTNATAGVWYAGVFGYSSCSYSITATVAGSCPNACSGHGTCNAGVCTCNSGWSGSDCSTGLVSLSDRVPVSGQVAQNSFQYYTFAGSNQMNYLLFTLSHPSDSDADMFVSKDGRPSLFHWDYANLTTFTPSTVNITQVASVTYYIGIYGYTTTSFQLTATVGRPSTSSDCPNSCSLHGSCSASACSCATGYSGRECETYLRPLSLGTTYHGFVGTNSWNYYHVQALTQNNLLIQAQQVNTNTQVADCDLYVRRGQNPTRFTYDYMDISLSSSFEVNIPQPANDVWYIGFYGWKACEYTVTVTESVSCTCPAGAHGRCLSGSTVCVCDDGWSGVNCDVNLVSLPNGAAISSSVGMNQWSYFQFTSNSSLFEVVIKETNSTGLLWLFVTQTHDYPSLNTYDDADQTPGVALHYSVFQYPDVMSYTYTIGVYGTLFINSLTDSIPFKIVAWSPSP